MKIVKIFNFKLFSIIALNLSLAIFGITWGLPHRWNLDSRIARALTMVVEKTFFYSSIDVAHPLVYKYFLLVILTPYYAFLKITGYDISAIKDAASISWLNLTKVAPDFVNNIMIIGRLSSAILGVLVVLLIYLIAKNIYNSKVGLFSALALTLNIAFIGSSHLIKNDNFSVFLCISVLYIWILMLTRGFTHTRLYMASFLTGLAIGTKLDAMILLCGTLIMILFLFKDTIFEIPQRIKVLFFVVFFIFCGLLFGYPRMVIPVASEVGIVEGAKIGFSVLFAAPTFKSIIAHMKLVCLNVASSMNIPITLFLIAGLGVSFKYFNKMGKPILLCYSLLVPYFFVGFFLYKSVATKLFILAFPILSIFVGYGFNLFWNQLSFRKIIRSSIALAILFYSIFYAVKADLVFAKYDTRYVCTEWIKNNIKSDSKISIIQDPEMLFSSSLVDNYKIYYYGEEIRYDNNVYRKVKYAEDKGKNLNDKKWNHQYAIVSTWYYTRYESGSRNYIDKNYLKSEGYSLIKEIQYDENLWFNPRPSYTSPTIFIFKKKDLKNA